MSSCTGEVKYANISEGNFTAATAPPAKQIAHVQVVRQGTAPFVDSMDIHPQTSTNPNRSSKAWDSDPREPKRILNTKDVGSLEIMGPSNFRIGIVNPGSTDTIVADVYVDITED
jgi:hypothetical protein